MNVGKASAGIIAIFIGTIVLLENLNFISFDWFAVISLWPVLIILLGINILLPKKAEGQILSIMATIAILLFFTFRGIEIGGKSLVPDRRVERQTDSKHSSQFSRDYDTNVKYAKLEIAGGAVAYDMKTTTDKLIDIETNSTLSGFSLSSVLNGQNGDLKFTQKSSEGIQRRQRRSKNNASIRLNANPVWDLSLEIGAGMADFDLRPFRIRNVEIEGGVSAIKMTLGTPAEQVLKLDFEGGMSSLDIRIPEQVSCVIHTESALSSMKFPGFTKQKDGTYRSDNYSESQKRIVINLENGLSSVKVNRY